MSRPDIHTVEHAKAYVSELLDILLAIEVSDAKMEEGSLRVDANVSVRPTGSDELRTRCELKNINSVRSLGRAIEYEARRHVDLYTNGEAPRQETRHWDEEGGRSTAGRSKEDADDYRYFQEPDLVPLADRGADRRDRYFDAGATGCSSRPAGRVFVGGRRGHRHGRRAWPRRPCSRRDRGRRRCR